RDMAGGRGRGAQRGQGGQAGRAVAIDKATVTGRQRRQRRAVNLGLVVGRDGQGRRNDAQRAGHVADGVVGVGGARGGDGVGAEVAAGGRRRRQRRLGRHAVDGVAVDEAAVTGRQRRQRRAVNLGLVVGRD